MCQLKQCRVYDDNTQNIMTLAFPTRTRLRRDGVSMMDGVPSGVLIAGYHTPHATLPRVT